MTQLSHDDNLKTTKEVISNFLNNLNNSEDSHLKWAIENLFREIERELDSFISGRTDLTITSTQVRNLFELYLITKHIYSSEEGLNCWLGQIHKDSIDVQKGFIALLNYHNKDVSELDEIRNFTDLSLDDSPYTSEGAFNIKKLAGTYGHLVDYSAIYKLCSKLIHPTSIKINAYSALTEDDNYLAILELVGVFFCQKIEELSHEVSSGIIAKQALQEQ